MVYKLKLCPLESMNEGFCVLYGTQSRTMDRFTDDKNHTFLDDLCFCLNNVSTDNFINTAFEVAKEY